MKLISCMVKKSWPEEQHKRSVFSRHRLMPLDSHFRSNNKQKRLLFAWPVYHFSSLSLWATHAQKTIVVRSCAHYQVDFFLCTILDSSWACIIASIFSPLPLFLPALFLYLLFFTFIWIAELLREKFIFTVLCTKKIRLWIGVERGNRFAIYFRLNTSFTRPGIQAQPFKNLKLLDEKVFQIILGIGC